MISVKKTVETKTDNRNRMDLCIGKTTLRLTEREAVFLVRQIAELYFGDVANLESNIRTHKGFDGVDLGKINEVKQEYKPDFVSRDLQFEEDVAVYPAKDEAGNYYLIDAKTGKIIAQDNPNAK